MDWKRVLQVVVCMMLVFSLFVGISPIRAEAVLTEAVLAEVVPELVLGLIIVALAHASGFIVEPPDEVHYADLGEAFDQELPELVFASGAGDTDGDGTLSEDEIKEEVEKVRANIAKVGGTVKEQLGSPEWGQLDYKIYGDLKGMAAIMGTFLAGAIVEGYLETSQEFLADSGMFYYNDFLLPELPSAADGLSCAILLSDNTYRLIVGYNETRFFYCNTPDDGLLRIYKAREYALRSNSWVHVSITGVGPTYDFSTLIWSNQDILYSDGSIAFEGSQPSSSYSEIVTIEPSSLVPDSLAAGVVAGGTASYSDIFVPEAIDLTSFFSGIETSGVSVIPSNLSSSGQALANGSVTINNYQQSITYNYPSDSEDPEDSDDPTDPTQDTSSGSNDNTGSDSSDSDNEGSDTGDSEQQPAVDTFAGYPVLGFLSKLGELLQNIFDGNLLGVKDFFEPFLSGIREDLFGIDSSIQDGFEDVIQNEEDINDSILDIYEQNQQQHNSFSEWFQNLIDNITSIPDKILEGIEEILLPKDDYLSDKVDDLTGNFAFADSIVKTGQALHVGLAGVTTEPPVIYIDLGAARGFHNIGGTVPFLDLRWYAEYKPTVDTIISAFLWICFVWRMLLKLPGIISGMPGDFVMTSAHTMGLGDMLPSRKKEYEIQRIDNRQTIRKGRG